MRLSDAGLRFQQTKLLYPDHLPSPWPTEDAAPRSLEPIVRSHARRLRTSRSALWGLTEPR
jgi:hypothetical protein